MTSNERSKELGLCTQYVSSMHEVERNCRGGKRRGWVELTSACLYLDRECEVFLLQAIHLLTVCLSKLLLLLYELPLLLSELKGQILNVLLNDNDQDYC